MIGRQYDKDGNLRQWWNNRTIKAFRDRTKCIVEQYDSYKLQPFGLKVGLVLYIKIRTSHVNCISF